MSSQDRPSGVEYLLCFIVMVLIVAFRTIDDTFNFIIRNSFYLFLVLIFVAILFVLLFGIFKRKSLFCYILFPIVCIIEDLYINYFLYISNAAEVLYAPAFFGMILFLVRYSPIICWLIWSFLDLFDLSIDDFL